MLQFNCKILKRKDSIIMDKLTLVILVLCLIGFITSIYLVIKFLKYIVRQISKLHRNKPIKYKVITNEKMPRHKSKRKYAEYIEACWNELK